ncbi:hypothetical protein D3C79_880700 [compost metagenome]
MEDVVDPSRSIQHALVVPDIADVELQLGAAVALAHVVLLLLIAAENADFGNVALEKTLEYSVAERPGAAGDEEFLTFEHMI